MDGSEATARAAKPAPPAPRALPRRACAARLRGLLRQAHMALGLSAGLVLMLSGISGAAMSFEDEIMAALSPGVVYVAARDQPRLSPDALIARFAAQRPDAVPMRLYLFSGDRSARIMFAPDRASLAQNRSDRTYLDPYDGRILGQARSERFFRGVRALHRFMLLPGAEKGAGRHVTALAAVALVVLALSGLYLRWPARALNWRVWLMPNLRLRGRSLIWSLHSVFGAWALLIYLTCAVTGLYWSYPWYAAAFERALAGEDRGAVQLTAPPPGSGAGDAGAVHLDPAWRAFQRETGEVASVIVRIPKDAAGPVSFRYVEAGAPHAYATSEIVADAPTGRVLGRRDFATSPLGEQVVNGLLGLHRGAMFGVLGAIAFMLAAAALPFFAVSGLLLYLGRKPKRR